MNPMQTDMLMQQAMQCLARQDYPAALERFGRVLQLQAGHAQALHNRGAVLLLLGRHGEALDCFERLLLRQPDSVETLSNGAYALVALQRPAQALTLAERALALAPRHAGAHNNRGLALRALGHAPEALGCFERALELQPAHLEALNNRGLALLALGRAEEALACFAQALRLAPQYGEALNNQGLALRALERHEEALRAFEAVLARQPEQVEALNNRGLSLADLGRHEEALACFERALAAQPGRAGTLVNRGLALEALQRHAQALHSYEAALALEPGSSEAASNRAMTLLSLNRDGEALASLRAVLDVTSDKADALQCLGVVLEKANRRREALDCLERSLALRPDHAETLCNRGSVLLALGELPRGFRDLEARWRTRLLRGARLATAAPLWLGAAPLHGRTLLLHHEQGFGDTLQFVRYVELLRPLGGRLLLRLPRPLLALMRHSLPQEITLIGSDDPLPAHELHCPLMSLPLALGTRLETIPASVPYLRAEAVRVAQWRAALDGAANAGARPRIGLSWAGRQFKPVNHRRDMQLRQLLPLLQLDARWISLQKDVPEADRALLPALPRLERHGEAVTDFADTAALIENLDLVITVDSAVAHLAGALGKPVWILNRHAACWRWLEQRSDSPWYPTARLFRQPRPGDWEGLVREVVDAAAVLRGGAQAGSRPVQPAW